MAALLISTLILPSLPRNFSKAASTSFFLVTSVEATNTSVLGNLCSTEALVSSRGFLRRPSSAIRDAPASAKYRAVSAPIPLPPPVTSTVLPLTDSSGRDGDRDAYVFACQVEVGDGKGAAIMIGRKVCLLDEGPLFGMNVGHFYMVELMHLLSLKERYNLQSKARCSLWREVVSLLPSHSRPSVTLPETRGFRS